MSSPLSPIEYSDQQARIVDADPIVGERKIFRVGTQRDEPAIEAAYERMVEAEKPVLVLCRSQWHLHSILQFHGKWAEGKEIIAKARAMLAEVDEELKPASEKLAAAREEWWKLKFGRQV